MSSVPRKVEERLATALKRFQPILASARDRDVNESDTVVLVTDLLAELFGYDKYTEITSEHMIRSTYCDLAVKVGGELQCLIEVKAIGLELKDQHMKQAVDYAANQGVEWVALTNGIIWRVFKVIFGKPINQELVLDIDLLSFNPRTTAHVEVLFPLTREGIVKAALSTYHAQKQATSNFFLAAVLLTDPVLEIVRRELRRLSPEVRFETADIKQVLIQEVLKREVVEGQKADEARKKVQKVASKTLRAKKSKAAGEASQDAEEIAVAAGENE